MPCRGDSHGSLGVVPHLSSSLRTAGAFTVVILSEFSEPFLCTSPVNVFGYWVVQWYHRQEFGGGLWRTMRVSEEQVSSSGRCFEM